MSSIKFSLCREETSFLIFLFIPFGLMGLGLGESWRQKGSPLVTRMGSRRVQSSLNLKWAPVIGQLYFSVSA